ncbi:MAG TPA: nucleotidyltransferase [Clostridiales bacterium]|nr:nucleotidyltransferase [Clostridiales bacterium]
MSTDVNEKGYEFMILGIIAEYNPFHNGHLYHLLKSKELTKDNYVVAIIGGNFTQRGEASLVDKWTKCEMALDNGVDLVIELPTLYSVSSAENFADGAIKILNSLKIVDNISFGTECEELNRLNILANTLFDEPKEYKLFLQSELDKGLSFPKARENALIEYLNDFSYRTILSGSNNILAIEYLKALKKHHSKINPIIVPRGNTNHLNKDYTGKITSSTSIREMIKTGNTRNLKSSMTPSSYTILKEELSKGHFVRDISDFEKLIIYNLRNSNFDSLRKLPDVSEGLEHAIKKAANSTNSLYDLISQVSSKRYTETRIKRILLYSLLGITQKNMEISKKINPYIRVLGFSKNGKELLSRISNTNPNLKIITSVKKFMDENINRNLNMMIEKDIFATNVYTLGYQADGIANLDFTRKIIDK